MWSKVIKKKSKRKPMNLEYGCDHILYIMSRLEFFRESDMTSELKIGFTDIKKDDWKISITLPYCMLCGQKLKKQKKKK